MGLFGRKKTGSQISGSQVQSTATAEVEEPVHEPGVGADGALLAPDSIHNTEDLAVWMNKHAHGKTIDLAGRTFRPKGGYEKDNHNLEWHEHPHPHWYLPFLPASTTLRNGTVVANARIALMCEGPGIAMDDLTIEGMGEPTDDARNALIITGSGTEAKLTNVKLRNVGCYIWKGANATLTECSIAGALHGVYVWGKSSVTVESCSIAETERACINVRDGAWVSIKDTAASGAKMGSALWVGGSCNVTAANCAFTGSESYGVEATSTDAVVTLTDCKLEGNTKGKQDTFGGGRVSVESAAAA